MAERLLQVLKVIKLSRLKHFVQNAKVKRQYDFTDGGPRDAIFVMDENGRIIAPNSADAFATTILKNARAAEPKVTSTIQNITSKVGGRMEGLDFRLKSQESLTRKIAADAELKNIPLESAASNINDSLRYTTILKSKEFGSNALKIISELESAGYTKVAVKNTFKKGSVYKGVNTIFRTESGQTFELQLHTESSFYIKQNVNHALYEEARLTTTTTARRQELIKLMRQNSASISPVQDSSLIDDYKL